MLDNTTLAEMKKKRCGVPDVEINDSSLGEHIKQLQQATGNFLNLTKHVVNWGGEPYECYMPAKKCVTFYLVVDANLA